MISNVDPLLPAGTLPALPRRRRAPSPFRYRSIHHVAAGPREAVADADPIPHFSVEADMASAYAAGSAWLLRLAGRAGTPGAQSLKPRRRERLGFRWPAFAVLAPTAGE